MYVKLGSTPRVMSRLFATADTYRPTMLSVRYPIGDLTIRRHALFSQLRGYE